MPRLPTGVPGFDAMVQGGLPVGSSVVLQGPPGQEKLRFALMFLAEGLKSGGSGLVVTSSQSPDAVIAELRELGVNLDSVTNENRLRVVDWDSWSEETVQVIEIERARSGDRIVRKIGVLHLKDTAPDPTFRVLEISAAGMRVMLDTLKPATLGSAARGSILESQDERAQRLRLILQIATERLKLNPGDADALFAMAAAQATLDDAKGGLETLDRLAALDSAYPGLWVLKTKLHAKLGQADLARQSRMRAQQSEPEAAKAIDATVPCPMCEEPVALDATSCANCGVKFTPTRSMEDELDDLGHAAIQEMVQEELRGAKGPEKALDKPDVRAPKPDTV